MKVELKAQFKVLLLGDSGVGKTTLLHRHLTGEFQTQYIKTSGIEVRQLSFLTDQGWICFEIWEHGGDSKLDGYLGSQAAIVMYDITARKTMVSVPERIAEVKQVCPNIPIVICGNKVDKQNNGRMFDLRSEKQWAISANSNYNFEQPFLYLARVLLNDPTLNFIAKPAVEPPEVKLDPELLAQYQMEA